MLEITRTPDGRLLVSTRRFAEEVGTEEEARRLLTSRGWGNLSISKALHRLKEVEGTAAPVESWAVRRPAAGEASAPKPTARVVVAEPAPVAERSPAPRRSRRKKAGEAVTAEAPAPEPAVEEKAVAPKKRRTRRKAAPEPTGTPAADEVAPAPIPELEALAEPKKKPRRAPRRAKEAPAPEPPDPAAHHAAELARALREREKATLPFARGPWTELRETAERILACLEGREGRGE